MPPARIGTLWIGPALGWLERLCLTSFVDQGHEVTVFGYAPVEGLPPGVRFERAEQVLATDRILFHARSGSPALLSDRFRYRLLAGCPGMIWADTDAYCLRPFETETGYFLGWQTHRHINGGVLGLPPDSPALAALLAFTEDDHPIPPFYPPARRADLKARAEAGAPVHVRDLPWGVWGPDALTHFLTETGEADRAFPPPVLYPIPFSRAALPLRATRRAEAEALLGPETRSIHFWGRRFRNALDKIGGQPPPGSLAAALLDRHGIATAPLAPRRADRPDFSMFDETDVTNLILQRSANAEAGPEIRAWKAGDDAPLQALARARRDEILERALTEAEAAARLLGDALAEAPPGRLADIGCGSGLVDLFLHRRFGCALELIDIETTEARHFGFRDTGAGFADLARARAFLIANGVPEGMIATVNPRHDDLTDLAPDAAISLLSCGYHYPVSTYAPLFRRVVAAGGRLIVDIRNGSGGLAELRRMGQTRVLATGPKHRTVALRPASNAVAEPSPAPAGASADRWAGVARDLAGPQGSFTDCGAHSFLYVPRGPTLVVTFDNLELALEKREGRRPWGFDFIARNGWSMLGVMAAGWTWFRDPAVAEQFDRLAASGFFARFERVVFYGASMGGYGAAAYSAAVPGATVVAISPQSTLDPRLVPWETRYGRAARTRDFTGRYGDAAEASRAAAAVHLFFDPHVGPDAAHAARFDAPNVRARRCPLLGHRLGSSLQQMGILQEIATAAIEDRLDPARLSALLRRRQSFPRYLRELARQALARGHPEMAARVVEIARIGSDSRALRKLKAEIDTIRAAS
ncbi:class I SAM-dependent methyltransferase [Rhodovulum kholense]|uniref:Methyltransferase family protein n=1 Tax=Rhodovulum kholense TaxID=453584 RepID=A0A8E3ARW5_9RHOB|nr:class I SAM-dependent methyltransferase [Rhodovulum kholense]PTW51482.1 hypothetical protein C8N38_102276 [Rhodovulum kholense]